MSYTKIKEFLRANELDYFIQPNCDEFFSEYLPNYAKRIEFLTNFTGSNAIIIIGQKKSYFFTDGRYIIQASNQIDLDEFEVINLAQISIGNFIEQITSEDNKIAIDGKLFTIDFVNKLQKLCNQKSVELVILENNPIDNIWTNQPKKPDSAVYFCDNKFIGKNSSKKRQEIVKQVKGEAILITDPQNLCWLLNIRASDVDYTPILLSYGLLHKNGKIDIFFDEERLSDEYSNNLQDVNIYSENLMINKVKNLVDNVKTIQVDFSTTNYWLFNNLKKLKINIINERDPIFLAKSIKNDHEVLGIKKAHEIDGLALTKFLFWLEKTIKDDLEVDEITASKKILEFRQQHQDFIYPSFATISSFASNGAIIHYQPNQNTNKEIKGNSLYLIDSGGQYCGDHAFGTTDVTRTILVGQENDEMIENFTRVLKGHIALARAKFPKGTNGAQLDVLARFHLWQAGLNYDHGTGHGVGCFLSVHEGPCGIGKNYNQELLPNMIISNEPGYYKSGEYGIRIESLLLVKEFDDNFLGFETLTLAPIDLNLVDFTMLTYPEKKWLTEYHQRIYKVFEDNLDNQQKVWLKGLLNP